MDHKVALCWDLFDRFVRNDGNIWEWIIRKEAPSDLGLMSALHNHTHTYVLGSSQPGAHSADVLQNIHDNIGMIQHMKAAQYTVQDNTIATPIGRIKVCYALLAKYAQADHLAAYIRQVRNESRPLPHDKELDFRTRQGRMYGTKEFLPNDYMYITTLKGALVLHNEFRQSIYTLNVTIGHNEDQNSDAFCFLIDTHCPVNNIATAQGDDANVRIFTHDFAPGWLEYILVAMKPIKKVTATTCPHIHGKKTTAFHELTTTVKNRERERERERGRQTERT
jgi:hypothetical protein